MRAHDHTHPVTKRTNYTFGEWDPHRIDTKGRYTRFVVRKIVLDSLLSWMADQRKLSADERLYDASAVLSGTMLMASAISGSGPQTFDSNVNLVTLLPKVARQRDAFYERLMNGAKGTRRTRLRKEAKLTQQPFGHIRQHLNITLARYGARQVQDRHVSRLYAQLGYPQAAREQSCTGARPPRLGSRPKSSGGSSQLIAACSGAKCLKSNGCWRKSRTISIAVSAAGHWRIPGISSVSRECFRCSRPAKTSCPTSGSPT